MQLPSTTNIACFVAAAELLNFSRAARRMNLTPAAFGQRIAQLEGELGVRLFERSTRRILLSEHGARLLPQARRAVAALQALSRVSEDAGAVPVEVTLGTRHELGMSWVVPLVTPLERAIPGLTIQLYVGAGPDLLNRVASGEIDAAVSSARISDPRLEGIALHREDYVFVASPRLIKKRPLKSAADAVSHCLIDIDSTVPLFRYWLDAPGSAPVLRFDQVQQCSTIAAVHYFILEGSGVGVLPEYFVRQDLARKRLVALFPQRKLLHDHFRLIHRRDSPRRTTIERIASELSKYPLR